MNTKIEQASVAETLRAVSEQLAALTERVAALEAGLGGAVAAQPAAAAAGAAAGAATSVKAAKPKPLDEATLVAISAAIAAYLGKRPTIRQIRLIRSSTWAQQGRVGVHTSHAFSRSGAAS